MPNELWWGLALAAVVVWWLQATRALEAARAAGRRACRQAEVQFLDDSVVRLQWRLERGAGGWMRLRRRYGFEFATLGDRRYRGWVDVVGRRVMKVELEPHALPEEPGRPSVE
ncbi:MAG: DUF3301 domain-containing protein [Ectothiorhodospiraceae bacterium]|nr:DUF3301 domain-containing protein [Ectothiorhodospiraceae bacterium]